MGRWRRLLYGIVYFAPVDTATAHRRLPPTSAGSMPLTKCKSFHPRYSVFGCDGKTMRRSAGTHRLEQQQHLVRRLLLPPLSIQHLPRTVTTNLNVCVRCMKLPSFLSFPTSSSFLFPSTTCILTISSHLNNSVNQAATYNFLPARSHSPPAG